MSRLLKAAFVEKLFGLYDYGIEKKAPPGEHSGLLILYGENGSGKTTLLKMIIHLLSPEPNRGHRTFLGMTRFQKFEVILTDDTRIKAYRSTPSTGAFIQEVWQGKMVAEYEWTPRHERSGSEVDMLTWSLASLGVERGHIAHLDAPPGWKLTTGAIDKAAYHRAMRQSEQAHEGLCSALADLRVPLHYLPDDRRMEKEERVPASDDERVWVKTHRPSDSPVLVAVKSATDYVRREARKGADEGSQKANDIYTGVVTRIVRVASGETPTSNDEFERLREKIMKLAERTTSFEMFGLVPALKTDGFQAAMRQASTPQHWTLLQDILTPYLDGIEARLSALEPLRMLLEKFIQNLNAFYNDKTVMFDLVSGFQILSDNGDLLSPDQLSSGERQLLLLLCDALGARRDAAVLIIDEPEISLNVKWQRKLLKALLDCVHGTDAQLIVATHSIELISQYLDSVIRLPGERHTG